MLKSFIKIAFFWLLLCGSSAASDRITVFAASSLSEAMEAIGEAFERETGTSVVFSFAGTGTLARQAEAGAPADVIVAADNEWMKYLADNGAVRNQSVTTIASNSLVLIGGPLSERLDLTAASIDRALNGGRLAIADPETVPAGRYGKTALENLDLWSAVETRLAPMENVRVALASVTRGDTPLGLVYATDAAIEPNVSILADIPPTSHPRIVYPAALTQQTTRNEAADFLLFLKSSKSKSILRSLGFVTDKED